MGTEVTAGGFGPVTFNKQVPAHLRTASPPREARLFSPNPRLAYQHTNLYVGASPSFDSPPCASRRDTRRERDAARDEHHSPAMPIIAHTTHARDGARSGVLL